MSRRTQYEQNMAERNTNEKDKALWSHPAVVHSTESRNEGKQS